MNLIWGAMIVIAIVLAFINGDLQETTKILFSSAESAVTTIISLMGILCMWSGFIKIAEKSGIIEKMSKKITPLIKKIIPGLPADNEVSAHIAMNITANMMGLGNVATPMGLKAMESLQRHNKHKDKLSKSMLMFVVLNTASIQLIPTSVIAIRSTLGSENPASIVPATIVSSVVSVIVGIILVKGITRNEDN